jgi:hypothetical protein
MTDPNITAGEIHVLIERLYLEAAVAHTYQFAENVERELAELRAENEALHGIVDATMRRLREATDALRKIERSFPISASRAERQTLPISVQAKLDEDDFAVSDQLRNLHAEMLLGTCECGHPWNEHDQYGCCFAGCCSRKVSQSKQDRSYAARDKTMDALPLIADAIAAAEDVRRIEATGVLPDFMPLAVALAALEDALKDTTPDE